jgi:hypothetical protein
MPRSLSRPGSRFGTSLIFDVAAAIWMLRPTRPERHMTPGVGSTSNAGHRHILKRKPTTTGPVRRFSLEKRWHRIPRSRWRHSPIDLCPVPQSWLWRDPPCHVTRLLLGFGDQLIRTFDRGIPLSSWALLGFSNACITAGSAPERSRVTTLSSRKNKRLLRWERSISVRIQVCRPDPLSPSALVRSARAQAVAGSLAYYPST